MHVLESLTRLINRFRYPVSLPEDVAHDLGVNLPNNLNYHEFLHLLSSPHRRPTKLHKFMSREQAEQTFKSALKKESFNSCCLFSYYFNKSWLVIALHFDTQNCLRRIYLQCPSCEQFDGFDIPLETQVSSNL